MTLFVVLGYNVNIKDPEQTTNIPPIYDLLWT